MCTFAPFQSSAAQPFVVSVREVVVPEETVPESSDTSRILLRRSDRAP
jgi:acyl CoA:acetate/3-ketoacid CoA transferase alpha subunit